jgi:catechol 2,3-dioxygenase-like lactoylglutathione lyase family enzyme
VRGGAGEERALNRRTNTGLQPELGTPRALNHIGLTVPDIEAAIAWYGRLFGFRLIMGPRVLAPAAAATGETRHILGPRFRKALQAHLVTANGVGLELFQFIDPPTEAPADNMEYWKQGYWHICFTDPDIEALADRIVAKGGRKRTEVWAFVPGTDRKLCYCEDPFGNVIELFSHSYEQTFANWPLAGQQTD